MGSKRFEVKGGDHMPNEIQCSPDHPCNSIIAYGLNILLLRCLMMETLRKERQMDSLSRQSNTITD